MNHWIALVFLAAGIILAVMEMATLTFYLAALSFASLATGGYSGLYPPAGWRAASVVGVAA
ncbi:MAG: NfeD family protein, partial [Gammaproteobacteria bacterium]